MSVLEALKRVNAAPPPEESVPLRMSVLGAVLAATTSVLAQGVGGVMLRVACLAVIPAGFWLSHAVRHRDRFWLKVGLAIGLLVAFGRFLAALGHVQTEASQVQVPLAELFLWVQVLHSLDVPARRDLMFSLAASLALVTTAGALAVSTAVALPLAVWGVAAVTSLVLAYHSQLAELPSLAASPRRRRWRTVVRPVAAIVVLIGVVGTGTLLIVPSASTARAVTFPARLPRSLAVPLPGGLSNPSLGAADPARRGRDSTGRRRSYGYFGFSDTLDTSVRGRPDHSLVLRVRSSRPDFWRGQTFDTWDGRSWSMSDDRTRSVSGLSPLLIPAGIGDVGHGPGADLVQTFYVERTGPNLVFAADAPAELYTADRRVFQLSDGSLRTGVELEQGSVYTVVSKHISVTPEMLRTVGPSAHVPQRLLDRYTQLPDVSLRVRNLASTVTADAPTTYDKVTALENWIGAHTRYSLDAPPLPVGSDAVDRFLFEDRVGFCEQIGSSLVVMLRSLGIPARLAVGFQPGERNPFTGLYEVHADDAHSWAEVWFPGVGWQAFDPTARVPLAGDARRTAAGSGLLRFLSRHVPRLTGVLAAVAFAFVAIGLGPAGSRLMRTWRRRPGSRTWADCQLSRLERVGARRGRPRAPNETAREYATALGLDAVGRAIEADVYSGVESDAEERAVVERVLAGAVGTER